MLLQCYILKQCKGKWIIPSYIWAYCGNPAARSHWQASVASISAKKDVQKFNLLNLIKERAKIKRFFVLIFLINFHSNFNKSIDNYAQDSLVWLLIWCSVHACAYIRTFTDMNTFFHRHTARHQVKTFPMIYFKHNLELGQCIDHCVYER